MRGGPENCNGCGRLLANGLCTLTGLRQTSVEMPCPYRVPQHKASLVSDAELARLRAIEQTVEQYLALYLQQPAPRSYESAWSLTLLEAILAGRGPKESK